MEITEEVTEEMAELLVQLMEMCEEASDTVYDDGSLTGVLSQCDVLSEMIEDYFWASEVDSRNRSYLSDWIPVSPDLLSRIRKHAKRYDLSGEICAWYADWEDFCEDWCDGCGYSRTKARKLLHGGSREGEFMTLPGNLGIVRFEV